MYSHDTYGLGHLRRNLALAHTLVTRAPGTRVVLCTGSRVAGEWPLPENVSLVPLPAAVKTGAEEYRPVGERSMSGLVAQRAGLICSTLLRVRPDVFLVDHAPLGMKGELGLTLRMAREKLPATRVVLGLRDIIDDPAVVRETWGAQGVYQVLDELYDQVLVYGCRELFDVPELYGFHPRLSEKTEFVGYVAKDRSMESEACGEEPWSRARRRDDRRILVLGGGGGDAAGLFHQFLDAWPALQRVAGAHALLLTGPLMDPAVLSGIEARVARLRRVEVIRFSKTVLSLIAAADMVVSMGGYNTVIEAVTARKPVLVCPRVEPRVEQLLRAQALARLRLVRLHRIDQGDAGTMADAVLQTWAARTPSRRAWRRIDLGGADRVADQLLPAAAERTVA